MVFSLWSECLFYVILASRQSDTSGPVPASKSSSLGSFYHLPSYLKLHDVLKATHANYKVRASAAFSNMCAPVHVSGDCWCPFVVYGIFTNILQFHISKIIFHGLRLLCLGFSSPHIQVYQEDSCAQHAGVLMCRLSTVGSHLRTHRQVTGQVALAESRGIPMQASRALSLCEAHCAVCLMWSRAPDGRKAPGLCWAKPRCFRWSVGHVDS